jgi:hypothetical protein
LAAFDQVMAVLVELAASLWELLFIMQVAVVAESTHQAEAPIVLVQAASAVAVTDKLVQAQAQAAQALQTLVAVVVVAVDKVQVQVQLDHIKVVTAAQALL